MDQSPLPPNDVPADSPVASEPRPEADLASTTPDDLDLGSFSRNPPWSLATTSITWRANVPALRSRQARRLPRLTKPPKLPPVGRAMVVLARLGRAVATWYLRDRGTERSRAGLSRRLRLAAEALGPTYIKLAQIISAGEGVFPPELVSECKRCRDQVPPVAYEQVVDVVEAELGRRCSRCSAASTLRRSLRPPSPRFTLRCCEPASRWWSRSSGRASTSWSAATSGC